jgi:hypothetical protein
MDGWLKALIAVACVVIIAGGGYYAIKENAEAQEKIVAEQQEQCEASIDVIASYKLGSGNRLAGSFSDHKAIVASCIRRNGPESASWKRRMEALGVAVDN